MWNEPRRWEGRRGTALADVTHGREAVREVLEALRAGSRALVRIPTDGESWSVEHAVRGGVSWPTTIVRQMVDAGYLDVTNATPRIDSADGEAVAWVRVPARVYWNGKGLERR